MKLFLIILLSMLAGGAIGIFLLWVLFLRMVDRET